jgi:hypothetical protein
MHRGRLIVMASVYSSQLYAANLSAGADVSIGVPAGLIWVVRDIYAVIAGGADSGGRLTILAAGISFYTISWPKGIERQVHQEGRLVMVEAQSLQIIVEGFDSEPQASVNIMGYVLTAP